MGAGEDAAHDLIYLSSLTDKPLWVPNANEISAEEAYVKALAVKEILPMRDQRVVEVMGSEKVSGLRVRSERGEEKLLEVNGVFIAVGTVPTADVLKASGVGVNEDGFIIVNEDMETNLKGVFAAGDCTGRSHQIIVAVGQGAAAGINASALVAKKGG